MPIVSLADLKEHLAFTDDLGTVDDALLTRQIAAAENHIERLLGYQVADAVANERAGFEDGVPPALIEAVCQLAAHWYENREAASPEGLREVPFGVREIVDGFRDWTF